MVKKKNILFVCKHNVFRSQVAKEFFNKLNKNKNYKATSAGIIPYIKRDLIGDKSYGIEKKILKKFGIKTGKKPKGINSTLLKNTDILIIVADDIQPSIFKEEYIFNGKLIVWKIYDVKEEDTEKERIILNSIKQIENKIKILVKELK